jgi:NADPH:quinone reductase
VQAQARAVGLCAVALAHHAGARVIGAVRSASDQPVASNAGADEVVLNDQNLISRVRELAPQGVDHIVEVAFGANVEADVELLRQGGSIASYATDNPTPTIPFWQMVFKNIRVFFLGSDDFPKEAKIQEARDLNAGLETGVVRLRNWRKDTPCRYRSCARTSGAPGAPWPHCRCGVSDRALKSM